MAAFDRRALGLATLLVGGCVFPGQEPTGLEASWRFVEGNLADGEEGRAVRTCEGADVTEMIIDLVDVDDESRAGQFAFDCELGFQTIEQFQTAASEAFIRLQPGDYDMVITARGADGDTEILVEETVEVAGRQITVEPYVVTRATFDWTIELQSTDTCAAVTLALSYDDAATSLAGFDPEAEDAEATPPYRQALASDRGLSLSGQQTPCTPELGGAHVVGAMDRGNYLLEVVADGTACAIRLDLGPNPSAATTVVDLANLPCNG